jgi:hypothetical protein
VPPPAIWSAGPESEECHLTAGTRRGTLLFAVAVYAMQEDFPSIELLPQQEAVRRFWAVDFVGNGPYSRRAYALPGEMLAEASNRLSKHQRYVRVACQHGQGRRAWSSPLFLDSVQ